jgi:hypothetical protein
MKTQEDIREEFFHQYRKARRVLAEARKRLTFAQESKGRVVALAMQAAEQRDVKGVAAQERDAKAGAAYKTWLDEMADAVLAENEAWTEVNILSMKWESWLEKSRNRRAEMRL